MDRKARIAHLAGPNATIQNTRSGCCSGFGHTDTVR
jgi:hypothetical protein